MVNQRFVLYFLFAVLIARQQSCLVANKSLAPQRHARGRSRLSLVFWLGNRWDAAAETRIQRIETRP